MSFAIKGEVQKRYVDMSWEFFLCTESNRESDVFYTFEITRHDKKNGEKTPTSKVPFKEERALMALSLALQKAGFIPESSSDSELRAVKEHLKDMRVLAMGKQVYENRTK